MRVSLAVNQVPCLEGVYIQMGFIRVVSWVPRNIECTLYIHSPARNTQANLLAGQAVVRLRLEFRDLPPPLWPPRADTLAAWHARWVSCFSRVYGTIWYSTRGQYLHRDHHQIAKHSPPTAHNAYFCSVPPVSTLETHRPLGTSSTLRGRYLLYCCGCVLSPEITQLHSFPA